MPPLGSQLAEDQVEYTRNSDPELEPSAKAI
jgi:hypothetical protein